MGLIDCYNKETKTMCGQKRNYFFTVGPRRLQDKHAEEVIEIVKKALGDNITWICATDEVGKGYIHTHCGYTLKTPCRFQKVMNDVKKAASKWLKDEGEWRNMSCDFQYAAAENPAAVYEKYVTDPTKVKDVGEVVIKHWTQLRREERRDRPYPKYMLKFWEDFGKVLENHQKITTSGKK